MKSQNDSARFSRWRTWLSVCAVTVLMFPPLAISETLIPIGANWRYLDTGIDQGTAWRGTNFNDGTWASGPAQLGYGDGDEATIINSGPANGHYPTTYFRNSFVVTNRASLTNVAVRVLRDDAAVVYLNGVEVFRSNMPDAPVTYSAWSALAVSGSEENAYFAAAVPPALLLSGTNVMAVEVHQSEPSGSDVSFNLELLANTTLGNLPPTATVGITPAPQIVGSNEVFLLNIAATDPETSVPQIDMFQDGVGFGTILASSATFGWSHPTPGIHEYMARPRDTAGMMSLSAPARVLVTRAGFQPQSIFFSQFASANGLIVQNNASISSNVLHLTQTANGSRGGVWLAAQQNVLNGFVSEFRFRIISKVGGGGDGLCFNIAGAVSPNIGTSIGYSGITNSLCVEFDTYMNTSASDPDDHHISVHSRGVLSNTSDESASLGLYTTPVDFSDGAVHKAKIEYVPGTLRVFLDNLTTPVLTVSVDFNTLLSLPTGYAWIGLAAGSGASYEYHDISAWSFTSYANLPPTVSLSSPGQAMRVVPGADLTVTAVVNDPNGVVAGTEFYDGSSFIGQVTNAPFSMVWSNISAGIHVLSAIAVDDGGLEGVARPIVVEAVPSNAVVMLFSDFSAPTNLILQGSAALHTNRLRLTPAVNSQTGAAWLDSKQLVAHEFETVFQFQINQLSSKGADGFAFVMQNNPTPLLGNAGAGLGYSSVPNSLAVEFDTFQNSEATDVDGNHIGIHSRGPIANSTDESASLARVVPPVDLSDGAIHTALIRYQSGQLNVFLDDMNVPLLDLSIDLSTALNLDNGAAWVGFTSATGGEFENHDILMWSFHPNARPQIQLSAGAGPFLVPRDIGLSAVASDGDGSITMVEFFIDGNLFSTVNAPPFTALWNNAPAGTHVVMAKATDDLGDSASVVLQLPVFQTPQLQRVMMQAGGGMIFEFPTTSGQTYTIQYSADLLSWSNAVPAITGNGGLSQWQDTGPPVTDSLPSGQPQRFYRLTVSP